MVLSYPNFLIHLFTNLGTTLAWGAQSLVDPMGVALVQQCLLSISFSATHTKKLWVKFLHVEIYIV